MTRLAAGALLSAMLTAALPARAADPSDPGGGFGIHVGLLRLDLSSIYDSNIDHAPANTEDYGVEAGLRLRLQSNPRNPLLWLEYRGKLESYINTDRWDRLSHRIRTGIGGEPVDGLDLGLWGELNTRASTEDREIVNQFTASPGITLSGSNARRLRLYGAYRYRDVLDSPDRDETIRFAGANARTGTWGKVTFEAGYRFERADAEVPEDDYERHRIEGELERSFGRRNSLRIGIEYRIRRYSRDLVEVDGAEVPREDHRWIPTLRWTHRLVHGQQILLEYEYQDRDSNNPDKAYQAHRIALSARWPFFR